MKEKRLEDLYIELNNGNTILVEQSKLRQNLDEMSNKFRKLLKKFKLI